jgi:mycofactocin precursor
MDEENKISTVNEKPAAEEPQVIEEIVVEELNIDGICGVY